MGEGFLGDILSVAEQCYFESLSQCKSAGFFGWFDPGEVAGEGCEECGELRGCEAGCTLV